MYIIRFDTAMPSTISVSLVMRIVQSVVVVYCVESAELQFTLIVTWVFNFFFSAFLFHFDDNDEMMLAYGCIAAMTKTYRIIRLILRSEKKKKQNRQNDERK